MPRVTILSRASRPASLLAAALPRLHIYIERAWRSSSNDQMSDSDGGSRDERRKNPLLRLLIDEMLEQVRELNRQAAEFSEEERSQAEDQLHRIMEQVRGAASKPTL